MQRLVFDLESDNLYDNATKIHCICIEDLDTREYREYYNDDAEIRRGIDYLMGATTLIGHNIIHFDLPVITKLFGRIYTGRVIDTLILSRLSNPDRMNPWGIPGNVGPHSVEAWGARFGGEYEKIQNEDWSLFTPLMLERCKRDTLTTTKIYEALYRELQQ